MSLEISLPLGKKNSVKNLVFTILTKEYPLKLIELTNFIRKRYGKAVTFQAVRKAVLELLEEKVILKENTSFLINKSWIHEAKQTIDELYNTIYEEKEKPKNADSVGNEVSIFTFHSLSSAMKFWENLIDNWFKHFKKGDYNINCYQSLHVWESLLYPETEKKIMTQMHSKGIKSYILSTGKNPLDKSALNFYKKLGSIIGINPSSTLFDKEYLVGTYGELVVQTRYPIEIINALDKFYKKTKNLENLDINELSDILNKKVEIKLSVIKNLNMAKQINHSIISQID
ncbi:hypothetical protein COU54_05320 [Candidatus Pacearchaeota archaeon CG10_big_fil_rev_8_21_14_0_10_31_24]|nr:MAG: hypothetical protein COU54_05320 [Candidatus Pacearchaeota archaeon CG10_big_fil_rev_8_21_14_0_10_31_24]